MKRIKGGITAPKGFLQAGIHSGIKKKSLDLALVLSEVSAVSCGVFTSNSFKAAPVVLSKKHLSSDKHRAVIINSGNANCLTGKKGAKDAAAITKRVSSLIGSKVKEVLICSTGIIGKPLPMQKINKALPSLAAGLHKADSKKAAQAIMTTDAFKKEAAFSFKAGSNIVKIAGIAKGAGMIAPDLATMISVITTDAMISKALLKKALKEAVADSFNSITVDGDMSTNDAVLILANGLSGVNVVGYYNKFVETLKRLCLELAKMIVKDGEGATKFIEIDVKGAKEKEQAKKVALNIANSLLFKTMCHGEDPNFGRIASACGAAKGEVNPSKVDIYINGKMVVKKGESLNKRLPKDILKNKHIKILVNLNSGKKKATVFTTDLSYEYVKINAAYS